jgi:hypothetical protein
MLQDRWKSAPYLNYLEQLARLAKENDPISVNKKVLNKIYELTHDPKWYEWWGPPASPIQ